MDNKKKAKIENAHWCANKKDIGSGWKMKSKHRKSKKLGEVNQS